MKKLRRVRKMVRPDHSYLGSNTWKSHGAATEEYGTGQNKMKKSSCLNLEENPGLPASVSQIGEFTGLLNRR
jgi:hypothetical protein